MLSETLAKDGSPPFYLKAMGFALMTATVPSSYINMASYGSQTAKEIHCCVYLYMKAIYVTQNAIPTKLVTSLYSKSP